MTTQLFKLCLILIATLCVNSCATFDIDGNSITAADGAISISNYLSQSGNNADVSLQIMSDLTTRHLDPCAKISNDVRACKCYFDNLKVLEKEHDIPIAFATGYLDAQNIKRCKDIECGLTCNSVANIVYDKPCETGNCQPCVVCFSDLSSKLQEIINPVPILFSDLVIGCPIVLENRGRIDYNIGLYQNNILIGNFKNSNVQEKGNGTIIQKFIYDGPEEVQGSTQLKISYKDQVGIQREITKTIRRTAN